jgi:glucuronokinase
MGSMSSTGRSIVSTCAARAALAGNPSDGYGGAVVAVPIPDLTAIVTLDEAAAGFSIKSSDDELLTLVDATAGAFRDRRGSLPSLAASVSTSIPRSVGLAGSSAIIIALLRALAAWHNEKWEPVELAKMALAVERDRLGIEAGMQDRLVQAVGKPVAMTFDPVGFDILEVPDEFCLFVAWSTIEQVPSATVHRSLRRRYDGGDADVHEAMRELALQAARARRGIVDRDPALLADAMHRTMALRLQVVDITGEQRRLVEVGRGAGAAVNSAGSGGSVVGLARHADHLANVEALYHAADFEFLRLV